MKHRNHIPTAKQLHALFEYKDGWLFWRETPKYGKVQAKDRAGYVSQDGYVRVGLNGVAYAAHRLIWRMHNPRGLVPFIIDHIDGNRANNVIENLRKVSHSENMKNRGNVAPIKPRSSGKLKQLLER